MAAVRLDVILAFNAEDADGLVDLEGAGWNHLTAPALPYTVPRIAAALFVHIPNEALGYEHVFTVRVEDPARQTIPIQATEEGKVDRARITLDLKAKLRSALPEHTIPLALVFHEITFALQGVHRLVVTHDGEDVREAAFDVRVAV